ncbi:hypothetical protein DRP77_11240, partial [Candidatus Poribacteria bacterium]
MVKVKGRRAEVEILRFWRKAGLSSRLARKTPGGVRYTVCEIPIPVHGLTQKTLRAKLVRDVYLRYRAMTGFNVLYLPCLNGFDPSLEESLKPSEGSDRLSLRKECRRRAEGLADEVSAALEWLGILGDWGKRQLNFDSKYTLNAAESIWLLFRKGGLKRKARPFYWCFRCCRGSEPERVGRKEIESWSAYLKLPVLKGLERLGVRVYLLTFSDHIRSLPTAVGVVFNPASKPVAALKGDEVYVLSS